MTAAGGASARGKAGAAVGVLAAGVAAGVVAERFLLRRARSRADDPYADERFGQLPFDESLMVETDDDLDIYVEIVEPIDGVDLDLDLDLGSDDAVDPTIVFVHGFCLDMGTFHFQRKDLTRRGDYRLIFYDQPGHGRSGRLARGEYDLDALGTTLHRVLEATVPAGPIVLVGHSMGGMTVMALAERHAEMFGDRVKGVVLISTSAGRLDEITFGLPEILARFHKPLLPLVANASRITAAMVDRARNASTDLAFLLTRKYGFGTERPSPSLVSYVERMNSTTPIDVIARYLRAIYAHARFPALEALKRVEVLAISGSRDAVIPLAHSEAIVSALPNAELVVIEQGGHMALLEHPEAVNAAILEFLEKIH